MLTDVSWDDGRNHTMNKNKPKITLETQSGVPLYVQIRDQIKTAIQSGQIPPQHRLQTIRELARNLKINPNTVARAYRELEYQGYLKTLSGRGTFVIDKDPVDRDFEPDFWIIAELEDCLKRIQNEWHVPPDRLLHMATHAVERISAEKIPTKLGDKR